MQYPEWVPKSWCTPAAPPPLYSNNLHPEMRTSCLWVFRVHHDGSCHQAPHRPLPSRDTPFHSLLPLPLLVKPSTTKLSQEWRARLNAFLAMTENSLCVQLFCDLISSCLLLYFCQWKTCCFKDYQSFRNEICLCHNWCLFFMKNLKSTGKEDRP